MSVYIKGMEMPAYCNVCPMQRTDNTGELTFCALTRKVTRWWMYDRYQSSEGHCPLIEIEPHGRLIDADALYKDGWVLQKQVMRMGGYATHEMPLTCPSLPIIIEAERKE